MMVLRHTLGLVLITALFTTAMAQETLSYQGHLADAARQPVNASYPMVFKLYADREGGDALWTEAYDSIEVLDGVFTVELGSGTAFGEDLARNATLFLGVSVNSAPEMSPRLKVSSTCALDGQPMRKTCGKIFIRPQSASGRPRSSTLKDSG